MLQFEVNLLLFMVNLELSFTHKRKLGDESRGPNPRPPTQKVVGQTIWLPRLFYNSLTKFNNSLVFHVCNDRNRGVKLILCHFNLNLFCRITFKMSFFMLLGDGTKKSRTREQATRLSITYVKQHRALNWKDLRDTAT